MGVTGTYFVDEEPVVIIDRRKDEHPGDDLRPDPPALQVPRDVVHEQGVGQTNILSLKIHCQLWIFMLSLKPDSN